MLNLLFLVSILLIFTGVNVRKAHAYQPVSHYILMRKTAEGLSKDSLIRKALETYPEIAAWGANGPDLGLVQIGEFFGNSPWSNEYHYFKVGTFTAVQLKMAIESGDLKKIAFAAGWATHVGGDLGCHGIFVDPECGVYLDNPSGRSLHIALEQAAEPYIWVNMGGFTEEAYRKETADHFCDVDEIPFDLMIEASKKVYGKAPGKTEAKLWAKTYHIGLKTGVGYKYTNYAEGVEFLSKNNRLERLKNSFASGLERCINMLQSAESGDFEVFNDRWNLDVGRSSSPISNLTLAVKTAKNSFTNFGTGTDDYVYFGMQLKDGTRKEWELSNGKANGITVNDFESGNTDKFYLYIDKFSNNIAPDTINKIWLRKERYEPSLGHDWYPEHLTVYANGQVAFDNHIKQWLDDSNNTYEKEVDFSNIVGIPENAELDIITLNRAV